MQEAGAGHSAFEHLIEAYRRGEVSRREFLERTRQLAVSGFAPGWLAAISAVHDSDTPRQNDQSTSPLKRADDVRPNDATRHGGYLCVDRTQLAQISASSIAELIERMGFHNEFDPSDSPSSRTIGLVRRVDATPHQIDDPALLRAAAIIHISAETPAPVAEFRREVARASGSAGQPSFLAGVVRPLKYTGTAMHNFAYAHRVTQQSGRVMPVAFLVPMTKTAEWWAKGWMERHTYFLPRHDSAGRMTSEGHALAAAAGISCLMRRTYWNAVEPAPPGEYDFISYFECTAGDVSTFESVCAALRDTGRNPEWSFVREGPTWRGERVAHWRDLMA